MPTIGITGGIGTSTVTGAGQAWAGQVNGNLGATIGVTVSVPVFDCRETKTSVNKAKLDLQQSRIEAEDAKSNLALTIQGFRISATTNQERFRAAAASVESAQDSYDLLSEQFRLGLKNIVELMTGKVNLLTAQQAELQAKYLTILNIDLLNFYQTGVLK